MLGPSPAASSLLSVSVLLESASPASGARASDCCFASSPLFASALAVPRSSAAGLLPVPGATLLVDVKVREVADVAERLAAESDAWGADDAKSHESSSLMKS